MQERKTIMSYSEDLKEFAQTYKYESITVGGGTFRYVLNGKQDGKTLVLLNGGMNTLEMWMEYVAPLSEDYQVLLFDYPQELRTNQELVAGFHMGAGGAAFATIFAQGCSMLFCILYLKRHDFMFDFRPSSFHFVKEEFHTLLRSGLPLSIQMVILKECPVLILSQDRAFDTKNSFITNQI